MATATLTRRKLTSDKYPGWAIEKTSATQYLLTRAGIFAISVAHTDAHGWEGTLMTRQRGGWAPAKTPYTHSVLGCTREADRREKAIAKYAARPLTR